MKTNNTEQAPKIDWNKMVRVRSRERGSVLDSLLVERKGVDGYWHPVATASTRALANAARRREIRMATAGGTNVQNPTAAAAWFGLRTR